MTIDYTTGDTDPTGERPGPWMQTFSGAQFFPLDIRAEDLHIADIAHALSYLCRYNGHTARFYSVAEHSILMTRHAMAAGLMTVPFYRTVLMHDAAEAYIGDYPYAVKAVIPEVKALETQIEAVLAPKFGLDQRPETKKAVKELDRRIVHNERNELLRGPHAWVSDGYQPLDITIQCWEPREARWQFLELFSELEG